MNLPVHSTIFRLLICSEQKSRLKLVSEPELRAVFSKVTQYEKQN